MGLPEVQINIQDPGLGTVPASAGKTQVKLGVCSKAVPNTLLSFGTPQAATEALGSGPLLEAVVQVLRRAGGPVLAMPINASVNGAVPANLTLTGSGTGTIAVARGPRQVLRVKIVAGGLPGVFTYQTALGAGSTGYGPTITSTADPYSARVVGEQFSNLVFGNVTYVANDVYTLNLDGTVTRTGTGPATALDASAHSPVDAYALWVQITTGGALGTAAFKYSLDGGNSWSADVITPSGGKFVVPNTGVVLTFAGTFTAADLYKGDITPPGFTNGDLTAALTALLANPSQWGFLHVIGKAANAAAALTQATTVGTYMAAAEVAFRYVRGIIECPQEEGDTTIKTTFQAFVDERVGVCVGDVGMVSSLTGRVERRNVAWPYTTRLSATKLSTHPGQVAPQDGGGALKGVTSIYRDEYATPGLDEARFVTARTIIGLPGYYITRGRMMASPGSDFSQIMNGRVMDRACTVARSGLLLYLNKKLRISDDGFIDERDAQDIEAVVGSKLLSALVGEDEADDAGVTVSRSDDLLATSTVNVEVDVVPFGYSESIKASIGFKNPALARAA